MWSFRLLADGAGRRRYSQAVTAGTERAAASAYPAGALP
jgi:hypothetical protein